MLHYIPPQAGLLHLSLPLASLSSGKGLSLTEHCHRDQTANENLAAPRTGIEPALPCDNQILSLARLPIPPSGRWKADLLQSGLQY